MLLNQSLRQYASIVLSFAAIGSLTGWLTGASATPVVNAILPLIFGLLGAFTYTLVDRHNQAKTLKKQIDDLDLDFTDKLKVKTSLDLDLRPESFLPMWGIAISLFCVAFYASLFYGARTREPAEYTSLSPLLEQVAIDKLRLKPVDHASLYNLYWRLRTINLTQQEIHNVFELSVVPAFATRHAMEDGFNTKTELLCSELKSLLSNLKTLSGDQRGDSYERLVTSISDLITAIQTNSDPVSDVFSVLLEGVPSIDPKRIRAVGGTYTVAVPVTVDRPYTKENTIIYQKTLEAPEAPEAPCAH
jgi:hypothetical protein